MAFNIKRPRHAAATSTAGAHGTLRLQRRATGAAGRAAGGAATDTVTATVTATVGVAVDRRAASDGPLRTRASPLRTDASTGTLPGASSTAATAGLPLPLGRAAAAAAAAADEAASTSCMPHRAGLH